MNTIDLHIHSKYSLDGEKEVQELFDLAKANGLNTLAVCDHNTTRAYRETPDCRGIRWLAGIELDCVFADHDFHVLGYGIQPDDPVWEKIRSEVTEAERQAGWKRLRYIENEMHLFIDHDRLKALRPNGVYEAETVCEVAMADPRNRNNPYLKEFFPGGMHSTSPYVDFFWEYCAKGKPAYAPIVYMPMLDAFDIYRSQGAKIVLAHPGNNIKEDKSLLDELMKLPFDGMEVYSSYHSPKQIAYYRQAAEANHLLKTCGSDYHGKTKPQIQIGDCSMPPEDQELLISALQTIKPFA
ncbi:PHP domain-containing protein [Catenisphaera adipataccumulans]|jgi:predicted metal-dependent phosphoesterase TrpH|uniref:Polymerase/histidinol phosphatase N-terminal domain-containing protein n=1 Tax=Catenisphaera adipataccumulans TaxID=700500 RepID=A0A7W8FV18_9FIRM|nr:PHP domain-containing protein [Catenisphaera adipataccumulans]MBB5183159.1 hypothetical protein [Catenisphaera adipataccumulans]